MVKKVIFEQMDQIELPNIEKICSRNDDGTSVGMLTEVQDGEVDTSVAGFQHTLERDPYADFLQGIFKNTDALILRTPVKSDQISYLTGIFHDVDIS